ncbi:ATF/CREB activator 2 [Nakaseomyces glabratus]|nr:ATF/CREB activator 2 [Nakaseomyces glabratus]KTB12976.1 ATF/CREB activator 2 [Nakaseomyces glabratus]
MFGAQHGIENQESIQNKRMKTMNTMKRKSSDMQESEQISADNQQDTDNNSILDATAAAVAANNAFGAENGNQNGMNDTLGSGIDNSNVVGNRNSSAIGQNMQNMIGENQGGIGLGQSSANGDYQKEIGVNNVFIKQEDSNSNLYQSSMSQAIKNSAMNQGHISPGNKDIDDDSMNNKYKNMRDSINNNPHLIHDKNIQQNLSPFYSPFGVDVSHLPMTSPPIFQNVGYGGDVHPRRRISISNGQISQLGEDIETVENLYNTQPPPMPQNRFQQAANNGIGEKPKKIRTDSTIDTEKQAQMNMYLGRNSGFPPESNNFNDYMMSTDSISSSNEQMMAHSQPPETNLSVSFNADNLRSNTTDVVGGDTHKAIGQVIKSPPSLSASPLSSVMKNDSGTQRHSTDSFTRGVNPGTQMQNGNINQKQGQYEQQQVRQNYNQNTYSNDEPLPGTTAWKKARLLERNRIAASKCRQRKKVAQMQLQKEYDELHKENSIIKRKLQYYEKLVSKFKKFSEAHISKCDKHDKESLRMIEEMLMIDSDINEVNESGLIVSMSER